MPGPWREVVHIAEQEGSRGGWCWVLTLSCGHLAFRGQPSRRPGRVLARFLRYPRYAPRKVRCLHCEAP